MAKNQETLGYAIRRISDDKIIAILPFSKIADDLRLRVRKSPEFLTAKLYNESSICLLFNSFYSDNEKLTNDLIKIAESKDIEFSEDDLYESHFVYITNNVCNNNRDLRKDVLKGVAPLHNPVYNLPIIYSDSLKTNDQDKSKALSRSDLMKPLYALFNIGLYLEKEIYETEAVSFEEASLELSYNRYLVNKKYREFLSKSQYKTSEFVSTCYYLAGYINGLVLKDDTLLDREEFYNSFNRFNECVINNDAKGLLEFKRYLYKTYSSLDFSSKNKYVPDEYINVHKNILRYLIILYKSFTRFAEDVNKSEYESKLEKDKLAYIIKYFKGLNNRGELPDSGAFNLYSLDKVVRLSNYVDSLKNASYEKNMQNDKGRQMSR